MFPDGLCRLEGGAFSKTIAFEDVNYRLAGPEDQRSIFESLCDFYNGYDPSIGVQVTLDSRSGGSAADEMFGITRQGNDLDPIRDEAVDILRMQYRRGNNGYVKTKYVTLTIEAENLPAARARFARIETDTLNRFKVMGAAAHVLDGKERWSCFTTSSTRREGNSPLNGTGSRQRPFGEGLHFSVLLPLRGDPHLPHRKRYGRCPSCKSWRPRCTTVSSPTSWRRTEISW